jgi:phospholipid/cholesterol/gamma-HCH transport system substrate-binding protein
MKNQRATEIKVGITVLFGLIVFIWILGWTKNFTFSSADNLVKVKFNNVSGLETGNNVTVNGVKQGHVKDFYIDGPNVIVSLSVSSDIKLKKDASFFLESTDLMGGRKIEINPGMMDENLDLSEIHNGTYVTDIAGVIALFSDLQDKISIIATETVDVLQSINSILKDEKFIQELKNGVSNLNAVSKKMNQVITENQQNLKQITENTKEITEDTKVLLSENKENIESAIYNLNAVMLKSDSLINSLNFLTQQTVKGENNLGKILYDDSLYTNLLKSIESIKRLSEIIILQLETDGINVDANIF